MYGCELSVEKGELEVAGLGGGTIGRMATIEFEGTLKEINGFARNIVFYPTDGESGWSKFTVVVKDLVDNTFCEGFVGGVCEEVVVEDSRMIWITAVNDAPVIGFGGRVGGGLVVEMGGGVGEIAGLLVSDDDVLEDGLMTVEVSSSKGRLTLNGRDGLR